MRWPTSPAAKMSGSEVRRCSSTTIPLSTDSPAADASSVLGVTPTPTTTRSAGIRVPSSSTTAPTRDLPVPAGSMRSTPTPRRRSTSCVAVEGGEDRRHLGTEYAQERQLGGLEDRDMGSGAACGGGGLEPDPAGADDDDARIGGDRGPQPFAVVDRPEVEHALEVRTRQRQAAGGGAGGEQHLVVAEVALVSQVHLVGLRVERGGRDIEPQVDVVLGVPILLMDEDRRPLCATRQVALGQRWTLVGQVRLGTDQRDAAVESLPAQRLGGLGPGKAGPDDDERGVDAHAIGHPFRSAG